MKKILGEREESIPAKRTGPDREPVAVVAAEERSALRRYKNCQANPTGGSMFGPRLVGPQITPDATVQPPSSCSAASHSCSSPRLGILPCPSSLYRSHSQCSIASACFYARDLLCQCPSSSRCPFGSSAGNTEPFPRLRQGDGPPGGSFRFAVESFDRHFFFLREAGHRHSFCSSFMELLIPASFMPSRKPVA